MNRREALAALVSLPSISRISRAEIQPTDVIVVECDAPLSFDTKERIKATLQQVWPARKIVVLEKGLSLKVVAGI